MKTMQSMFAAPILLMGLLLASCQKEPSAPEPPSGTEIQIKTEKLQSDKDGALVIIGDVTLPENTAGLRSYGICWSETKSPTVNDNKRNFTVPADHNGQLRLMQSFSTAKDGLTPGKEYHARVFVEQGEQIVYGEPQTFSVTIPKEETGVQVFEIPVVFHILYKDADDPVQNPRSGIFFSHLSQVNRLFQEHFASFGFPTSVRFKLAETRPDGTPFTEAGLDRVCYPGADDMTPAEMFAEPADPQRRALMWDPYSYLNIWLFTTGDYRQQQANNWMGTATTAILADPYPLDGCAVATDYFNHIPSLHIRGVCLNNKFFLKNGIKTLAHEIGHILGLWHPFSEIPGYEYVADYCPDTPDYDRASYEANALYWMYERQAYDGTIFTSDNIMDYWYSYNTAFTAWQCARMEHVLHYGIILPDRTDEIQEMVKTYPTKSGVPSDGGLESYIHIDRIPAIE